MGNALDRVRIEKSSLFFRCFDFLKIESVDLLV